MDEQHIGKGQDREDRKARKYPSSPGQERTGFNLARSGLLTASLIVVALLVFAVVWRAHQKATFHQLTSPAAMQMPTPATVGGVEPIKLTRLPLEHSLVPEFSSVTLLPGLGMQVLQVDVTLAGGQTYRLLEGPTIEGAAGMPPAAVDAAPFHLMLSPAGQDAGATTDVIATNSATDVVNRTEADGGEATGTFAVLNAAGRQTGVEAKVDAELTGRSLDLTVRVHNNALSSREFSLTWSPHFAAPGGSLSQFLLTVPSTDVSSAAGKQSVKGTPSDFSARDGRALTDSDTDLTYVDLQRQEVREGPSVRLVNRRNGVVLRVAIISPTVRSVRVRTDSAAHTLMLSFGTRNGTENEMLQAGESAEWHVRLDLSALKTNNDNPTTP